MQAGKYKGKLIDWAVSQTRAGDDKFLAIFDVEGQHVIYTGMFKTEKSQEITLKAMIDLGLKSPELIEEVVEGVDGKALELGREVMLTIVEDEYQGKKSFKVRYINPLRSQQFQADPILKAQARTTLAGLKGQAAALMQSTQPKKDMPF